MKIKLNIKLTRLKISGIFFNEQTIYACLPVRQGSDSAINCSSSFQNSVCELIPPFWKNTQLCQKGGIFYL